MMRSPLPFFFVLVGAAGCAGQVLDGGTPASGATSGELTPSIGSLDGDASTGAPSSSAAGAVPPATSYPPTGIYAEGADVARLTPYPRNRPEVLFECSQPVLAPADRVVPRTLNEIILLLQGGLVRCEPGTGVADLLGVGVGADVVGFGLQASNIGGPLSKVLESPPGATFDYMAPGCIEGYCLGEQTVGYPTLTTSVFAGAQKVTRTHDVAFDRTRGVLYLTTPEGETIRFVRLGN